MGLKEGERLCMKRIDPWVLSLLCVYKELPLPEAGTRLERVNTWLSELDSIRHS